MQSRSEMPRLKIIYQEINLTVNALVKRISTTERSSSGIRCVILTFHANNWPNLLPVASPPTFSIAWYLAHQKPRYPSTRDLIKAWLNTIPSAYGWVVRGGFYCKEQLCTYCSGQQLLHMPYLFMVSMECHQTHRRWTTDIGLSGCYTCFLGLLFEFISFMPFPLFTTGWPFGSQLMQAGNLAESCKVRVFDTLL